MKRLDDCWKTFGKRKTLVGSEKRRETDNEVDDNDILTYSQGCYNARVYSFQRIALYCDSLEWPWIAAA